MTNKTKELIAGVFNKGQILVCDSSNRAYFGFEGEVYSFKDGMVFFEGFINNEFTLNWIYLQIENKEIRIIDKHESKITADFLIRTYKRHEEALKEYRTIGENFAKTLTLNDK